MTAVVIEGMPFDYMESMFNMHFENTGGNTGGGSQDTGGELEP
jgi:hypothetical protein